MDDCSYCWNNFRINIMYYIIMFIATTIFASIAWVANYSKNAGWSLFFLASISYFIAFCVFALLCILKKKPMFDAGMWKDGLKPVIILLVGNMSLNVAVSMTTPEKIGFLVGLTVIIVPILDFFMYKAKIPKLIYPSLIFAFIGNFILNYNKEMKIFSFGLGEFLSLATTVCYALSTFISYIILWFRLLCIRKCLSICCSEKFISYNFSINYGNTANSWSYNRYIIF